MKYRFVIILLVGALACQQKEKVEFDLQGHRGCRGLYPENSITGFFKAIDMGVNTLEMDLAVTKDRQLVISHEPYISTEICRYSAGDDIPDSLQFDLNIYQMNYEELRLYDCGTKLHPRFPDQKKIKGFKPNLEVLLNMIASMRPNWSPSYNIEIKSSAKTDNLYHPTPQGFSHLVYEVISRHLSWDNVTIQSFDFRVLQYFHETYPEVNLALLIENDLSIHQNLDSLGFQPDIYSCDFTLLSRESVAKLHERGISVIPWTVNQKDDMRELMEWGVDGLITDYPNRFNELTNE